MKVKDIMCKDIIVMDIESSLYEISKTMKEYDIGFMPISKENKIIGVLTDRDIVTRIIANKDDKIAGYITKDIISIDENKDINEALTLMSKHKIKRLIVTSGEKVIGIISLGDLLQVDNEAIKCASHIFEINRNTDKYITKINEFYL